MEPLDFLVEEFGNVERVLGETLRHDYGPESSSEIYYSECATRLSVLKIEIKNLKPSQTTNIHALLIELSKLATRITAIERSHLGEFSWPFAGELRKMAKALFAEKTLAGEMLDPIVHVIADGEGYKILNENTIQQLSSNKRIVIVLFPRTLKNHVLLHALFGHELCHTAFFTNLAGAHLNGEVQPALSAHGPLKNKDSMDIWLSNAAAPREIKELLKEYETTNGEPYLHTDDSNAAWLREIICDLFGLVLFGPSFLAAHRDVLRPVSSNPYAFTRSHPPYAIRHKMLLRAIRLLHWNGAITNTGHKEIHDAELELLSSIQEDPYDSWADVFDDQQVAVAIDGVTNLFTACGTKSHQPIDAEKLVHLVDQLKNGIPPVVAEIEDDGTPKLQKIEMSQTLYAGWVCWEGRKHLQCEDLGFFDTNRLCDHALLQQQAINLALSNGIP